MLQPLQAHQGQFLGDQGPDFGWLAVGVLGQREAHVLGDGHGVEQGSHLEQVAEPPAHRDQLPLAQLIDALGIDVDFAPVGPDEPEHVLEQHALAGA